MRQRVVLYALGFLVFNAVFLCARAASANEVPLPRGFPPELASREAAWERAVDAAPSTDAAARHERALASEVHRMGSRADLRTAQYVRDRLRDAGWDAQIVTYVVAIAWPVEQRLQIVAPVKREIDLYEPAVRGDPWSANHAAIGKPYSGYSADGDAVGPLVYANFARPEDFDELNKSGVATRGAIVLARVGKGALGAKASEAAERGAKAVLFYSDPMDGGYFHGDTYPDGPWRPLGAAVRNTMTFANPPGDPTSIGVPLPGAPHKPFSAMLIPSIPEMPITANTAASLMRRLGGPTAPFAWHGGLPVPLHLGGVERVHLTLKSKRFFGPIWDVIATLQGDVKPAEMVVVGGHRDAWTYGAVDPISGTVDLVQLGEALGKLRSSGWRPYRTVIIGSWDGEEVNLFGSEAWVEQHETELKSGCVAYINTDEVAVGPDFSAYATPDLSGMLKEAAAVVTAPDGTTLATYWKKRDPDLKVDEIGAGSDHEPFVFHEGLPAAGAGYDGPFGTYHSAYDDLASLRIFDPGMKYAAAAARYTNIVTLRLASAPYPDLRLADLARSLQLRIDEFAKTEGSNQQRARIVEQIRPLALQYVAAAQAFDRQADSVVASGSEPQIDQRLAQLRLSEAAFFTPTGLRRDAWQRSLLYGMATYQSSVLPTLEDALDTQTGEGVLGQLQQAFNAALAALHI